MTALNSADSLIPHTSTMVIKATIPRYKDPARHRPFRVPFGAWLLPMMGAVSCLFLMYYLPPTSWWRFIAWLMIGLSIYLSYGYARSELGRKFGRWPITTPGLKVAGLGFFLVAIGLFTIPHDAGVGDLFGKMSSGMAEGKRTIFSFVCIVVGLAMGIVGSVIGTRQESVDEKPS